MVIEAFDKSLYATVEDSMFALEEIPKVQLKSQNFDEILPTKENLHSSNGTSIQETII